MTKKNENSPEFGLQQLATNELLRDKHALNQPIDRHSDCEENEHAVSDPQKHENSYLELFNLVTEAIYIQNAEGTFLDVNNSAVAMYGYAREEFIGRNPEFLSAPGKNNLAQINEIIRKVAKTGNTEKFEFWGLRKNGGIFPKEVICMRGKYFGEYVIIATALDINDSMQVENALRESEEKYRMLLENSPDAIILADLETGNIIDANIAATILLGRSINEIKGMHQSELHPLINETNSKAIFEQHIEQLTGKSATSAVDNVVIRKDGTQVPVEILASKITINSRPIMQGVFRDITGRKLIEEALEKSTARLNRAELSSKSGNWEWHLDSGQILASKGAVKLYGLDQDTISLSDIQKMPLPEYRPLLDKARQNLIENGEPYNLDFKIKKTGSDEILDIHSIAEYDKEKHIIFGVIQDVTGRKRAEKIQKVLYNISGAVNTTNNIGEFISFMQDELGTLLDTTNFYIAFYDEATDMLSAPFYKDENDDISMWSAKNSLTGYVVKNNEPLLIKNSEVLKKKFLKKFYKTGINSEVWLGVPLREDGKVTGAFVVQSYNDPNAYNKQDVELLEFISDQISISLQRKKAEQALKAAKDKAEESDRLKTAFLANMSHEIRTPMNGILGFAELLDDDTLTPQMRREFISIISSSSKQLLTVINDIIDISKIESGQLIISNVRFNLNDLLQKMLMTFENVKINSGKTDLQLLLEKDFSDSESYIICDDVRLSQVFYNLLGNALKFTRDGFIKFGYRHEKGNLLFYVEDSGKGIPQEKQRFIFERFRQVDETNTRQFGGTGLGLSISRGLVELMGGTIWVNSKENEGSAFQFTISDTSLASARVPVQENHIAKPERNFKGFTILVAEDILSNFNLIQVMLKKTDVTLLHAKDGIQAVKICRDYDHIDLILMDIQMPEMNGYEAIHEIRQFRTDIPIIALTAYAYEEDKIRAFDAGCNDFIAKPIDREGLMTKLSTFFKK